ncbi:hypothetical protein ACT3TZ_07120 [Brachybacterium sp. AOP25-B2-12]|uniref:hypothetical protein n=1 Tax=Brachybacterium sp. AOP25-B2-12 TaxID=3457710 RepID=UPI00403430AB
MTDDELRFIVFARLENVVSTEVVRYQVSVSVATPVVFTPARRDPDMAADTVRLDTPDARLVLVLEEWLDREVRLQQHVREWMLGHVQLRGAKVQDRASDRDWVGEMIRVDGR